MIYDSPEYRQAAVEPMEDSRVYLERAVVGHRVVKVEEGEVRSESYHSTATFLTLDDGTVVEVANTGDCCAYTEVNAVIERLPGIDHIITAVITDGEYQKWFLIADGAEVWELDVDWSEGNAFYYGYGFSITVLPKASE